MQLLNRFLLGKYLQQIGDEFRGECIRHSVKNQCKSSTVLIAVC